MSDTPSELPFISLIMPMRNEERFVEACVRSIASQDYPSDKLEMIIADGMSTDRSREILAELAGEFPFIRMIDNPNHTVPYALNAAIRESRGRYILRLDCHAEYADDYIRQCVRYLELTGAENVGGPIVTFPGADTTAARCVAAITSNRWVVGGSVFRTSQTARYSDGCIFGA